MKTLEGRVSAKQEEKNVELQGKIDKNKKLLKDAKAEHKLALKGKDEELKEWKKEFEQALGQKVDHVNHLLEEKMKVSATRLNIVRPRRMSIITRVSIENIVSFHFYKDSVCSYKDSFISLIFSFLYSFRN